MVAPDNHTLPPGFVGKLKTMWSDDIVANVVPTFTERLPTARINTLKISVEDAKTALQEKGVQFQTLPWSPAALIILNKTKREITELPENKHGLIYIQSLASMLPPLILNPQPGERILDLTAAPGSKTSQIAALMNNEGLLVANDSSRERFFRLKRNMEALGVARSKLDLQLRLEHGSKIGRDYPNFFDRVLLDAPCSAEARFISGDESSFGFWKEKKVGEIAKRQRPLLLAALNALKPGGIMVYSTCTISPEENELQIDWLLKKVSKIKKYESSENVTPQKIRVLDMPAPFDQMKVLPSILNWRGKELEPDVSRTIRLQPSDKIESFFVALIQKI